MIFRHSFRPAWHLAKQIYRQLHADFQVWAHREIIDDEYSSQTYADASLMLNVCQSTSPSNFTYFEFDQFFDDEAAGAELFCNIEY